MKNRKFLVQSIAAIVASTIILTPAVASANVEIYNHADTSMSTSLLAVKETIAKMEQEAGYTMVLNVYQDGDELNVQVAPSAMRNRQAIKQVFVDNGFHNVSLYTVI